MCIYQGTVFIFLVFLSRGCRQLNYSVAMVKGRCIALRGTARNDHILNFKLEENITFMQLVGRFGIIPIIMQRDNYNTYIVFFFFIQ